MAKNIKVNIDIKSLAAKLGKNLGWLFIAIFLILLILEGFEVKNSVSLVLSVNQPPQDLTSARGVRINFDAYNQVINRIQSAPDFQPSGGITQNPFSQ